LRPVGCLCRRPTRGSDRGCGFLIPSVPGSGWRQYEQAGHRFHRARRAMQKRRARVTGDRLHRDAAGAFAASVGSPEPPRGRVRRSERGRARQQTTAGRAKPPKPSLIGPAPRLILPSLKRSRRRVMPLSGPPRE
jgi:hypothetical protein